MSDTPEAERPRLFNRETGKLSDFLEMPDVAAVLHARAVLVLTAVCESNAVDVDEMLVAFGEVLDAIGPVFDRLSARREAILSMVIRGVLGDRVLMLGDDETRSRESFNSFEDLWRQTAGLVRQVPK